MITREDVLAAQSRIAEHVRRTPLQQAGTASAPVWLKCEFMQHTGSFKARGAFNRILTAQSGGTLDSAVGIAAGLQAAAALETLDHACGLGTGSLFVDDVTEPVAPQGGYLPVRSAIPDPARLATLAAAAPRRRWWIDRITQCHPLLSR